jgi:hypothetical protein
MKFTCYSILVLFLFLLAGCSSAFDPSLSLSVDTKKIQVTTQELSDFVTVTVIRRDDNQNETSLVLKFPDEFQSVYAADSDGKRISTMVTKSLKGKNAKDVLQFKIYSDNGEAVEAHYVLNLELWWNETKKETAQITVISKD